eukprot:scaffold87717_cov30-Tisochrysis_lutea.AAC.3
MSRGRTSQGPVALQTKAVSASIPMSNIHAMPAAFTSSLVWDDSTEHYATERAIPLSPPPPK